MKRNLHKLYIYTLLLIACHLSGYAVEIQSTHITSSMGLSNNTARYILQDDKGFIWFGTLDGLCRYDGNSFVTLRHDQHDPISIANNRIVSLHEDKNLFIWIKNSSDQYSCYDTQKDCFVDFTGCKEYHQLYSDRNTMPNGDIWLWHKKGNGCRQITYHNGIFHSKAYSKSRGNFPFDKIRFVYGDKLGRVWIGADKGVAYIEKGKVKTVNCYKKQTYDAIAYKNTIYLIYMDGTIVSGDTSFRIISRLNSKKVTGIAHIKDYCFISTKEGGYLLNLRTQQITQPAKWNIKNATIKKDNNGDYIFFNKTGKIWFVNSKSLQIKSFQVMPSNMVGFIDHERYNIVHDSRDLLWITTYGNGLFVYDIKKDHIEHILYNAKGNNHIYSNYLMYAMEDHFGGIWISSEFTGVSRISVQPSGLSHTFVEDANLYNVQNAIRMISKMPNGEVWVSSRHGYLYAYDSDIKQLKWKKRYNSNIYSACTDLEGNTWLGTRSLGLLINDKIYREEKKNISNNSIYSLLCDSKGRMWVGTLGDGMLLASPAGKDFHFKSFLPTTQSEGSRIRVLFKDKNGYIWAGSSLGFYIFHPDQLSKNPKAYIHYYTGNSSLKNNEIRTFYQDRQGKMWIGSAGDGVCVCNPNKGYKNLSFQYYDTSKGLSNNMVQSIIGDKNGYLWIATAYGMSRLNATTGYIENYLFSTNALGNVYEENSAYATPQGDLLFGTQYGMVRINPDHFNTGAPQVPTIHFTELVVNGELIHPSENNSPITEAMAYAKEVRLRYDQNTFAIHFSTFDFSDVNSTKYSYKLEGYDKEWNAPSNLSFAAFKNLPYGSYTLHVKVFGNNGKWEEKESYIKITILPPFWLSWWAYLIYTFLLLAALYFIFRTVKKFNNLHNSIAIEKQLTEYKLVFFTNISHEFRTPLTLIEGGLDKIQTSGKMPQEIASSIQIINKSCQRLKRLIDQLLEFRKIQNNKESLALEQTDVITFLYEIYLIFKDSAAYKNINYQFDASVKEYQMYIDKSKLDKIVYNLLSNAFKYTPAKGTITLHVCGGGRKPTVGDPCDRLWHRHPEGETKRVVQSFHAQPVLT